MRLVVYESTRHDSDSKGRLARPHERLANDVGIDRPQAHRAASIRSQRPTRANSQRGPLRELWNSELLNSELKSSPHLGNCFTIHNSLFTILLLAAGCCPHAPTTQPYVGSTMSMDEVVAEINNNNEKIPSLWSELHFKATIIDKKETHTGSGEGVLMYRRPERFPGWSPRNSATSSSTSAPMARNSGWPPAPRPATPYGGGVWRGRRLDQRHYQPPFSPARWHRCCRLA